MKIYEAADLAPDTYEGEYFQPSVEVYKKNDVDEEIKKKDELLKEMARAIHYPRCWDTMAYPTLADAVIEVYKAFRCERRGCR